MSSPVHLSRFVEHHDNVGQLRRVRSELCSRLIVPTCELYDLARFLPVCRSSGLNDEKPARTQEKGVIGKNLVHCATAGWLSGMGSAST
jgi:hypothetical protein